jgi:serine/threonine-protein kinase
LRNELARAGLLELEVVQTRVPRVIQERSPVLRALSVFAFVFVLIMLVSVIAHRMSPPSARVYTNTRLELAPEQAGHLLAVARPWAVVFINGQQVEVTPFANAVPLSPGRHFVRFDHPAAPSEHRTIDVQPNESVLLEVEMKVAIPSAERSADPLKIPALRDGGIRTP